MHEFTTITVRQFDEKGEKTRMKKRVKLWGVRGKKGLEMARKNPQGIIVIYTMKILSISLEYNILIHNFS